LQTHCAFESEIELVRGTADDPEPTSNIFHLQVRAEKF